MSFNKIPIAVTAFLLVLGVGALDNGLAVTPQMGCEYTSPESSHMRYRTDLK